MSSGVSDRVSRCSASRLLREVGLTSRGSPATDALSFSLRCLAPRSVLKRQGDRLSELYVVLSGCLKSEISGVYGDTQISAFLLSGDALGLDGLADRSWHRTVIVLEPALVAVLPLDRLTEDVRHSREMADFFHHIVGRELDLASRRHYIVAPPTAEGRLARFLVDLAVRQAMPSRPANTVRLSMTKSDVASHLGLAHETISRAFAALTRIGYIDASGRDVRLLEMEALQNFKAGRRLSSAEQANATPGLKELRLHDCS